MEKKSLLLCAELTGRDYEAVAQYCDIEKAGLLLDQTRLLSEEELLKAGMGKEIVCVYAENATARCIDTWAENGLKLLGCSRGTPVNVDWKAAHANNIPIVYTPGRNAVAVAEFTIGLILGLSRSIANTYHNLKTGSYLGEPVNDIYNVPKRKDVTWKGKDGRSGNGDYPDDFELNGRTIGIVGFGAIGKLLAGMAKGFNMKVLAYDPYVDAETVAQLGAKKVELEDLYANSDIVSIHLPVTPETQNMVDADAFSRMKQGAIFVNTARAATVEQKAFMDALESGRLAGACLDVVWDEPIPENHPLLEMDNVLITPHIGGITVDVPRWQSEMLSADIINYCTDKPLERVWTRLE